MHRDQAGVGKPFALLELAQAVSGSLFYYLFFFGGWREEEEIWYVFPL